MYKKDYEILWIRKTRIWKIELMDFMDYLFKTPTLGSTHSAGKKIMEVIRNIWKSSSSTNKIGFDKNFYYHSRARYSNVAPYVSAQMLKAPVERNTNVNGNKDC